MCSCKGIKYTMTESGLARAEASTELSLWSKLKSPLRRSSVQTISNTGHVRAKATPNFELSLLSKLSRVTKLKPERGQCSAVILRFFRDKR